MWHNNRDVHFAQVCTLNHGLKRQTSLCLVKIEITLDFSRKLNSCVSAKTTVYGMQKLAFFIKKTTADLETHAAPCRGHILKVIPAVIHHFNLTVRIQFVFVNSHFTDFTYRLTNVH